MRNRDGCPYPVRLGAEKYGQLVFEQSTGADFSTLTRISGLSIDEIWHELGHFYFDFCDKPTEELANRRGELWTPTEEESLWLLYLDGASPPEISVKLSRSTRAVIVRLLQLGFPRAPRERLLMVGLDPEEYS